GGYRQLGGLDDHACTDQRLVARHLAVTLAEHARLGAAGGRQRLETEPGEHTRGARVPLVGDHERPRSSWSARKPAALSLWLVVISGLLTCDDSRQAVYRRNRDAGSS